MVDTKSCPGRVLRPSAPAPSASTARFRRPAFSWSLVPGPWSLRRRRRAKRGGDMPVVMDADRISRALVRIAHEIVERNRGVEQLAVDRRALARRAAGPAHRRRAQEHLRRRRAGRRTRHHALPRRPDAPGGRPAADRPPHRDPVLDRRPDHRAGRRRPVHRPHHPRRARRADRLRPPARHPAGGAGRPRPPRAADQGRLRRQEHPDLAPRERARAGQRHRRPGRGDRRERERDRWTAPTREMRRRPRRAAPQGPARHRRAHRPRRSCSSSTPPRR